MTDVALVKNDLYNHIFTRKGERIKMPNYGTTIPDMLFEPLTDALLFDIDSQLRTVFRSDPRIEIISLDVYPFFDTQTVYIAANLRYIELDTNGRFDLNLEFKG